MSFITDYCMCTVCIVTYLTNIVDCRQSFCGCHFGQLGVG